MSYKRNKDYSLQNLVVEFEQMHQNGKSAYFDENTFFKLIDYYEKELFFDKALQVIDCALGQFGYSTDLHLRKAQILLMTRNSEMAMSTLDKAQIVAPAEIEIQLLKAKVLASMERYGEALEIIHMLKDSAGSDEDLSGIYFCEGHVYEVMKDFDRMYEVLRQSLYYNPDNEKALEKVWVCSELTRKFEESIVLHHELIDRRPYNYLAWYNLGQAHACLGSYEEAIEAYEYSFIINSDFDAAYIECAELCCELREYTRALNYYLQALNNFGPDEDLYASIGFCYLKLTEFKKAQKYLRRSLRLDPYNDEVYYHLGMCKYEVKDWDAALDCFQQAVEIEDRREEYYLYLAKTYWQLEDMVKADYYFSRSTEVGPEQVDSWREHALFLYKNNDIQKALEIVEEGIVHAMDPQLFFVKSAILFGTNQREEAYLCLKEGLKETTDNVDVLYIFTPQMQNDKITQDMIAYYEKEINATY